VFFDLNCTGADGENFLIEMQRGERLYFADRTVYYVSRLVSEQFKRGETDWKRWGLKEVYLISLLEFVLSSNTYKRYLRNIALTDTETGEVFYSKLGYKFIELPNFVKTEVELVTDIDKRLYLLKNLSALKKIPAFLNKSIFQRVFKIAEVANLTNQERVMYDASLKSKLDYEGSIAFAEDKAFEKGLEKGAQMGRAKAEEDKRNTARNLKDNGISMEIISNSIGYL
jgi:predicted transposase/invertase (TIGR01784 family)